MTVTLPPRVKAFLLTFLDDERGQMLPVMALMMVILLGMAGFTMDLGRALYNQRALQASTDAAAMAGAQNLPASTAVSTANQYSAVTGYLNAHQNLPNVTMVSGYPRIECLSSLMAQGMACSAPGNGNAMMVRQQIVMPLLLMPVLGFKTMTLTATATASMNGSTPSPYNVVIVVDSTASMNSLDSDSNCNSTRLACAMAGVQVLLQNLSPCGTGLTTCGAATNGNVSNAVDTVSLYTFPAVASVSQAQLDFDCSTTSPQIAPYQYPVLPVYQIVGFSSDYRTSSSASSLAGGSNLVKSVGGKANCTGLEAVGGEGTYYAGVIYAAQAALVAQALSNPGTKNILILLSDGDASAPASAMPGASTTSGVYPSTRNQCHQAITAAAAATAAGTRVYAIAYGATDTGCATDTLYITPCQTMQQIASAPQDFYSDYTAKGASSSCVSASSPVSSLNQIFTQIAGGLTVGRLIPNNAQ
ncbi:Tad domain-containing protein [Granulicella arctica]|uniref:Tad domain-containing protein n=1 Tax=Granulicella arctica TaxID=940613 RepID=UPI0021DF5807|nr:Tad domain-containing protein [Granulicella arctica]